MKKRVFLALLAAAAVTFVGCSKDDDGPDEGPQTYTITFEGDDWSPLVVANYNGGIIGLGGRLTIAIQVLPTSSSGS